MASYRVYDESFSFEHNKILVSMQRFKLKMRRAK